MLASVLTGKMSCMIGFRSFVPDVNWRRLSTTPHYGDQQSPLTSMTRDHHFACTLRHSHYPRAGPYILCIYYYRDQDEAAFLLFGCQGKSCSIGRAALC